MEIKLKRSKEVKEFIGYASFESNPEANERVLAINLEELKQELDSLFSTGQYERPYLPDYYNPLEDILGELWTEQTKSLAYHLVINKINQYIPRIAISNQTSFSYENYKVTMNLVFYYKNDLSKELYNYTKQFDIIT